MQPWKYIFTQCYHRRGTSRGDKSSKRNFILRPWDFTRQAKESALLEPATMSQSKRPCNDRSRPSFVVSSHLANNCNMVNFKKVTTAESPSSQKYSGHQCQLFWGKNLKCWNCSKTPSKEVGNCTNNWLKMTNEMYFLPDARWWIAWKQRFNRGNFGIVPSNTSWELC